MKVVENICPECKKSNEPEAMVCGYCGPMLEDPFMDPGASTKTTNVVVIPGGIKDWSIDDAAVAENGIAVYIEGEFQPVHVETGREFVIGRKSGKTAKIQEDLFDLSPMG